MIKWFAPFKGQAIFYLYILKPVNNETTKNNTFNNQQGERIPG